MWYLDKGVRGSELELRQEEGKGYKSAGRWKWTQRTGGCGHSDDSGSPARVAD